MQSRRCQEGAEGATLRLVQQHAAELLRFAQRFSHCADDACDAYQRSIEILVRRMRTDPPVQPLPWLRTVIRHEALAVRSEREELLGRAALDLDRHEDRLMPDPAERAVRHERVRHTAEALRRLKPQELTALVLRAEGLSYAEISSRMRWSYTRTNRCVTEGRRALLERLGAIESGAECTRWLPRLSALADGEASAQDVAALRPHLRGCPACRATLRELHAASAHVALLVPPAAVGLAAHAAGGGVAVHAEAGLHALLDRMTLLAARFQGAFEGVPGAKLAAVAASTAALAGGGVALEHATSAASAPLAPRSSVAAAAPDASRLTTITFPSWIRSPATRREQHSAATSRGGEFAREPAAPSEFTPRAAPPAEFTPRAGADSPPAAAQAASSSSEPGAPSEFASP
jgi:RNA polymerase sigma factor (sigma-70 family)